MAGLICPCWHNCAKMRAIGDCRDSTSCTPVTINHNLHVKLALLPISGPESMDKQLAGWGDFTRSLAGCPQ
eukprot:scaffold287735_cov20-Prasinocladus_malaysianus.AAC.1